MQEGLKTIINWEVPEEKFLQQVEAMMERCEAEKKVITLPVLLQQGSTFAGQLGLLLSMVNCNDCDGLCCYEDLSNREAGEGIEIINSERNFIFSKGYGDRILSDSDGGHYMAYPCPFYSDKERGKNCRYHDDRPLSCIMFPFQPGGFIGEERFPALSVSSQCPEGRRLAKLIYINTWRVRNKIQEVRHLGL